MKLCVRCGEEIEKPDFGKTHCQEHRYISQGLADCDRCGDKIEYSEVDDRWVCRGCGGEKEEPNE